MVFLGGSDYKLLINKDTFHEKEFSGVNLLAPAFVITSADEVHL